MFTQGCHAFTLAETPVSLDGNLTETYKKWCDSAENAATETRVNVMYQGAPPVMYPLTETCACRHVSATVLRVYGSPSQFSFIPPPLKRAILEIK